MGFFKLLDDYMEFAYKGMDMFPLYGEVLTFLLIIVGLCVLVVLMIPYFIIGLILKPNALKERDAAYEKNAYEKSSWTEDYDY